MSASGWYGAFPITDLAWFLQSHHTALQFLQFHFQLSVSASVLVVRFPAIVGAESTRIGSERLLRLVRLPAVVALAARKIRPIGIMASHATLRLG